MRLLKNLLGTAIFIAVLIGGWVFVFAVASSDQPFMFGLALCLGVTTFCATLKAVPEIYRAWTTR
jgi:hypothetical protein